MAVKAWYLRQQMSRRARSFLTSAWSAHYRPSFRFLLLISRLCHATTVSSVILSTCCVGQLTWMKQRTEDLHESIELQLCLPDGLERADRKAKTARLRFNCGSAAAGPPPVQRESLTTRFRRRIQSERSQQTVCQQRGSAGSERPVWTEARTQCPTRSTAGSRKIISRLMSGTSRSGRGQGKGQTASLSSSQHSGGLARAEWEDVGITERQSKANELHLVGWLPTDAQAAVAQHAIAASLRTLPVAAQARTKRPACSSHLNRRHGGR